MTWSCLLALLLSVATAVLIVFGGLVTNTGAALAVPDWPTTFGYNMFLYPWAQMVGGVFYEHGHRLIGSLVGLLTILLAVVLWVTERRRWLRWLGLGAVVSVSVQGLMGGLRVVLLNEALAIVHGALAQAFFGLTVALVVLTSRAWREGPARGRDPAPSQFVNRLALCTTVGLYLQILLGTLLTHRAWVEWHLVGAACLLVLIPALGVQIQRRVPHSGKITGPATGMQVLFLLQLLLGLGSYLVRFTSIPLPLASFATTVLPVVHRLTGALLLGASLVLTLWLYRLSVLAKAPSRALSRTPLEMKRLPA